MREGHHRPVLQRGSSSFNLENALEDRRLGGFPDQT